MRNFTLGVFPDFGTCGAVMRVGVGLIFVLIWVVGVGNFAREFFRHRIIAARIFRFDRGGAYDYFRAESLQQIDFFARLLVVNGEDYLVASHGRHERKSHASIARRAFDDRAAGPQHAFSLGFIDHVDGDAVFHGAARIEIFGLHIQFGENILGHAIQAD